MSVGDNGSENGDPGAAQRRAAKSATAFRTISEVADELNLPQHVLRFWESKFNQIRPLKRGGGRRYYRPEDVELLRRIRRLLYTEGYTIKGVQKVLRENGSRNAADAARIERDLAPPAAAAPQPAAAAVPSASATSGTLGAAKPAGAATDRQAMQKLLAELEELRDLLRRGRR
ncbi:MAG TPA: MerR family transcriptional regulator [Candidatus Cybelea sp.]|nr:MerR family transcriptional regulator [Candidatus Cybelea sp.]